MLIAVCCAWSVHSGSSQELRSPQTGAFQGTERPTDGVSASFEMTGGRVEQKELERSGQMLRADLEQCYRKLRNEKKLHPNGSSDVTALIEKYIPLGTSFDNAEAMLRFAGFSVDPRPNLNNPPTRWDSYYVVAAISPFAETFISKTSLYVSLIPRSPGDYTSVSKISAGFTLSTL